MRKPSKSAVRAYESINKGRDKFGNYIKSCFHIHTPASYDYRLTESWSKEKYESATDEEIYQFGLKYNIFKIIPKPDDITLSGELSIFNTKKEFLSYILIANALIDNGLQMVVVTDHNTLDGVEKLKEAIRQVKTYKNGVYPEIITGIEISCADKNHIVGIFDNDKKTRQEINNWLSENLINSNDGTFKSSLDALEFIKSIRGIGYIAHINSSDMLQKGHLSGGYKTKLLSNQRIVGISSVNALATTQMHISKHTEIKPNYIIDNDAHYIEALNDNFFWIKGSKFNFETIKEALNDYDISISFNSTTTPQSYIKGLYIENTNNGFLNGKNNTPFCVKFSPALNCIIGGRGTGKSSVLEMMEYILSQRCETIEKLDFLCSHGDAWILYYCNNDEYLIKLNTPKKGEDDNILRRFGYNEYNYYRQKYNFNGNEIRHHTLNNYIQVFKIIHNNEGWNVENVSDKKRKLKQLFDTHYSVNELVNTASSNKINNFIYETMFSNKTLSNPAAAINVRKKSGLKKMLENITATLQKRSQEVSDIINPFNMNQKNVLRIKYSQEGYYKEPPIFDWLFPLGSEEKWYKHKNIRLGDISGFLLTLYENIGIWEFLSVVVNGDVDTVKRNENLLLYCKELTTDMVDQEISEIKSEEVDAILKEILSKLITDNNISEVIKYLKDYIANTEVFTLEFNVYNREGTNASVNFKSVNQLSLGQKVVAMLSFILGYSEYSGDYRPLLIDQPEDNLDNQYIYKNLVKQLRQIKEKRQIIIATHNATIVTNAKADQVCVMNSDNTHGWIETTGYPGEKKIKKHIINYLEGGKESFVHKMSIYDAVLHD